MDDKPKWASDLELSVCGQFYQGFVDDYTLVLAQHCMTRSEKVEEECSAGDGG